MKTKDRSKLTAYQRRVISLMTETFKWNPMIVRIVENTMARLGTKPIPPHFELICDDPISANWRLKRDPGNPSCFRLADYRMTPLNGELFPPRPEILACLDQLEMLNRA